MKLEEILSKMGATTLRQRGGGEGKRVVDEHVLFSDSEEVVVETVRKSGKDGDVAGEKRKTYGKVPSGEGMLEFSSESWDGC